MNDIARQKFARLKALIAQDEINIIVNPKKMVKEARDAASELYQVLCEVEDALRSHDYIRAMIDPASCMRYEDLRGKETIRINTALDIINKFKGI